MLNLPCLTGNESRNDFLTVPVTDSATVVLVTTLCVQDSSPAGRGFTERAEAQQRERGRDLQVVLFLIYFFLILI